MLSFSICSIIGAFITHYIFFILLFIPWLRLPCVFIYLVFFRYMLIYSHTSGCLSSSIFHVVIALSPELSILLQIEWFSLVAAQLLSWNSPLLSFLENFIFFFSDWSFLFQGFYSFSFLVLSSFKRSYPPIVSSDWRYVRGLADDILWNVTSWALNWTSCSLCWRWESS